MREQYKGRSIFSIEHSKETYQSVAINTGGPELSQPIHERRTEGSSYVLLFATADCHIRFTSDGSMAVLIDTFLPANIQTAFYITPGNEISVLGITDVGILHISPVV